MGGSTSGAAADADEDVVGIARSKEPANVKGPSTDEDVVGIARSKEPANVKGPSTDEDVVGIARSKDPANVKADGGGETGHAAAQVDIVTGEPITKDTADKDRPVVKDESKDDDAAKDDGTDREARR